MKNFKNFLSFLLIFVIFSQTALAATFTVNDNGNGTDASLGDGVCNNGSGVCTLRAAMAESNSYSGTDTIQFTTGNMTITPSSSALPTISSNMTIDGSTAGAGNTIAIVGTSIPTANGLTLDSNSDGSQIRGLYIYGFSSGVGIELQSGAGSITNPITIGGSSTYTNVIGLQTDRVTVNANAAGIVSAGTNVTIDNNFVSGNTNYGIRLINGSKDVTITKNTIGLDTAGADKGNGVNGIEVADSAISLDGGDGGVEGLIIGGSKTSSQDNWIGGNTASGIRIGSGSGSVAGTIKIKGNKIGLNGSNVARANDASGILIDTDVATANITIGTEGDGSNDSSEGNEIGSNGSGGVYIQEGATVVIAGNKIGVTDNGVARGNTGVGVAIGTSTQGPDTLTIGSDNGDNNEMNTISNNTSGGILVNNATTVNIAGNFVGFSTDGTTAAGNGGAGISVGGVGGTSQITTVNIGGSGAGGANNNFVGNNTSGNGAIVVSNTASGATVKIKSNIVGIGNDYATAGSNSMNGIYLSAPANYTIGTDLDGTNDSNEYNMIGNNTNNGIVIANGVLTASIVGNIIGLAAYAPNQFGISNYTAAAANGTFGPTGDKNGIKVASNSITSLTIGGSDSSQRNYVASSGEHGIFVSDAGSAINFTARNNYIGLAGNGSTARGNTKAGIAVADGGEVTLMDNVIASNGIRGIDITGGTGLVMTGNKVGTDSAGTTARGNTAAGLRVAASTIANVSIGSSSSPNVFVASSASGDGGGQGIYIVDVANSTTPVTITGNYVGLASDGTTSTSMGNVTGIQIDEGAVTIGGDNDLANGNLANGNIISGSTTGTGIYLNTANVSSAGIYGSVIGLKKDGSGVYNTVLANASHGIMVNASALTSLTVGSATGTTVASRRNIISSNGAIGMLISNVASNAILSLKNNYIGTDISGAVDRGNSSNGMTVSDGGTVNIGGTSDNEGNVISGNTSNGVEAGSSNTITLNIYKNIIGLNAAGTAALANDSIGVRLTNANAIVNFGGSSASSGNTVSGNGSYGMYITGGNVTVNYNKFGVGTNGTTSIPNGNNDIYAEGGNVSFLKIGGPGNTLNDTNYVPVYLKDIVTTYNETNSYLESDNTWLSRLNLLTAPRRFWERYVGTTLSGYGPKACYDYIDNDRDGYADTGDPGCSNVQDDDEYNDSGGGFVYASTPLARDNSGSSGSDSNNTATGGSTDTGEVDAVDTEEEVLTEEEADIEEEVIEEPTEELVAEEVTEEPAVVEPVETPIYTRERVRDYVIREKLTEAVNTTTDAVLGKDRINLDLILNADEHASMEVADNSEPVVRTPEQEVVTAAIDRIAKGENLDKAEERQVERNAEAVLAQSVQKITEGGTGAPVVVSIRKANGKELKIDKNTRLKFSLDHKKAADEQDAADARGENIVVLTPSTVIGRGRVAAMLQVMEGGDVDDALASDKIFFRGISGLRNKAVSIDELKPDKLRVSNFDSGMEIGPKAVIWITGPKAGQKFRVFAVDKADSNDPNLWKIYELGTYTIDDAYKAAVDVDFSDKMASDTKKFQIVVQDENGNGSVQEVTVNKGLELKMDSVLLRNGKEVIPADLTDSEGSLAKIMHTTVLLASESAKQAENNPEGDGPMLLSGYAEPGGIVFVTWESAILSSTVIADASQGYFEVEVPKELAKGEHNVLTYGYNKNKRTVSNFVKVLFSKYL